MHSCAGRVRATPGPACSPDRTSDDCAPRSCRQADYADHLLLELAGSADRALAAARAVVAESAGKAGYPTLWQQAALAVELCQRAVEITGRVLPGSYRPGSRAGAGIRR